MKEVPFQKPPPPELAEGTGFHGDSAIIVSSFIDISNLASPW